MNDRIEFAGDHDAHPRDVHTRCVCGHLLFIHVDADRVVAVGDEPPYGVMYERRGECLHADCACREPQGCEPRCREPRCREPQGCEPRSTVASARTEAA